MYRKFLVLFGILAFFFGSQTALGDDYYSYRAAYELVATSTEMADGSFNLLPSPGTKILVQPQQSNDLYRWLCEHRGRSLNFTFEVAEVESESENPGVQGDVATFFGKISTDGSSSEQSYFYLDISAAFLIQQEEELHFWLNSHVRQRIKVTIEQQARK